MKFNKYILFLPIIIIIGLTLSNIDSLYFKHFVKPKIIKQANGQYFEYGNYKNLINTDYCKKYGFVVISGEKDKVFYETFYNNEGNKCEIKYVKRKWKSTSGGLSTIGIYYGRAGFIIFMIGALLYNFRTKSFFRFPGMKKHKLNNREFILITYGATMVLIYILTYRPTYLN